MGEAAQQMLVVLDARTLLSQPAPPSGLCEDRPGELAGEEPLPSYPFQLGIKI